MADLEQHFMQFNLLKNNYDTYGKKNKELYKALELLHKEVGDSRETENCLRQQLNDVNKNHGNNQSISLLYTQLKVKNESLIQENGNLKKEIVDLKRQSSTEKDAIILEYMKKIEHYENQLVRVKDDTEQRELHFNNEIQLCQASMALQIDEVESKWERLLSDANQKLKDANNTCNTLRSQVVNLNTQLQSTQYDVDNRIQELESKLVFTESQLAVAQEKVMQQCLSVPKFGSSYKPHYHQSRTGKIGSYKLQKSADSCGNDADNSSISGLEGSIVEMRQQIQESHNTKYEALPTTSYSMKKSIENIENYDNISTVSNLYQKNFNVCRKTIKNNNGLPPLKQVGSAHGKNLANKKRKLFNPNDLDYLNEMEVQE